MSDIATILMVGAIVFVALLIGEKQYNKGYNQAIHDCQQNTFDSDTIITFKPIEK